MNNPFLPPHRPFRSAPWHSRGYLPHFDLPGQLQSITFRLADSLPQSMLAQLERDVPPSQMMLRRDRVEELLDRGLGECWLRQPDIAELVESTLLHFDGQKYRLLAWVVMPNHLHWLIETLPQQPLSGLVKSVKSYTARQANRILGRSGAFWQRDYWDRAIRDAEHLIKTVEYMHNNPVKAALCARPEEWRFSSAWGARLGDLPL